jgi:thiol-disulfide isomerase/thioredoxin
MKKIVILLSVTLLMATSIVKANSGSVNWMHSFEDAMKMSKALNKPILLDFTAYWCAPCQKMDSDVWSKEEVQEVMENYIPVKIDFDVEKKLVNKYNVKGIPFILILDGWGNKLHSFIGYRDKLQTLKILKEYTLNLTTIHSAMSILEKSSSNLYSNIRVAQKFQDVAFIKTGNLRKALLKRSNHYLKVSEKLAKKEAQKDKEKIELLELLNKAYHTNYKSALKKIDKDFNNLDETNLNLYNYIKFYCNHQMNNKDEANTYSKQLTGSYKMKADYLLNAD